MRSKSGTLIIVGGHENKDEDPLILKEVARHVGDGKLVVATVASDLPNEMWDDDQRIFRRLGVRHLHKRHVETREDAAGESKRKILDDATGVFFTGGDQPKITSLLGASPLCERLDEIYSDGGLIAGTSAGASVMSDTMLVGGGGNGSARIGDTVRMAPGLSLINEVLIDQHFAERGRVGRLLGAVAQNPRQLGVGIDENTAIVLTDQGRRFRVIGEGAVYVINGWDISYAKLTEEDMNAARSVFGTRIDVLSQGDEFDMETRTPKSHPASTVRKEIEAELPA